MSDRVRVAVLYGGTSAEHEVSVVSARAVIAAMDPARYDVLPIAISRSGAWLLPATHPGELPMKTGVLPAIGDADGTAISIARGGALAGGAAEAPVDVVFPVLHGPGGEDGTIQGMLDALGIPYVGSGVAASAVGMDKALQKPIFKQAGIPVTPWIDIRLEEFGADAQQAVDAVIRFIGLPCFTKPAALGSSVGVRKCTSAAGVLLGLGAAFEHGRVAIVERAVQGRELECAVLGNDEPQASVVGEIVPAHEFYDYDAKYLSEGSDLIIPADIPSEASETIRGLALQAFRTIGCAGMARVDFFLADDGTILLNEINTIPGFTPISMYPKLWEASGVAYPVLIDRLIELALERHRRR